MALVPAAVWTIFDHFNDNTFLRAIGDEDFPAMTSPRRNLDAFSRRAIMAPALAAIDTGKSIDQMIEMPAGRYRAVAFPIVIPDGSRVCGAVAAYVPEGQDIPKKPVIGTWQWRVDRDGNNVGANASQWNRELFEIHELDPDDVKHDKGPVGEWLTRLIPSGERSLVKSTVDEGLAKANGDAQLLTFGAITRLGTANPGRKQLALVGAGVPVDSSKDGVFAFGFTREVPAPTTFQTTGLAVVGGQQFASAMLGLLHGTAIAGVDCVQSYTYLKSPSWDALGMDPEFAGDFPSLAAPDDRAMLEQLIERARRSSEPLDAIQVHLQTATGDTAAFAVRAASVDVDQPVSRYVLLAVARAEA